MVLRCDYLVVGAGASGLAFVDSVFHATDASFVIVDRRDAPGGHWNDAYPFVRLHQPAIMYGVASCPLGSLDVDVSGVNAGMSGLASGPEVVVHFHRFVRDTLLPSGRVTFLSATEHVGGGECVSVLSGERTTVEASRLVDATLLETTVPARHRRSFAVDDGVACVPVGALPVAVGGHRHFVVLGAGKTAIDAVCWLLANGAAESQITWVMPRDQWLHNRALTQPGPRSMTDTTRRMGLMYEAMASASSVEDLELQLEAVEAWRRVSPDVRPAMMHAAVVSDGELAMLRRVSDVIRLGHVLAVHDGELELEGGSRATPEGSLVIDCTASALKANVGVVEPVFSEERIALQMIRQFQPCFSSALIGHIEATITDHEQRVALTAVAPMTDTVEDWIVGWLTSMGNQAAWSAHPDLRAWMARCRLDLAAHWNGPDLDPDERRAAVKTLTAHLPAAIDNLSRLQPDTDRAA